MNDPRKNPYAGILPPSPPGDTIRDIIWERGWAVEDFAGIMDMSKEHAELLLRGNLRIDRTLAENLGQVLGSTPEFWLRREENYRLLLQVPQIEKIEQDKVNDNDDT